MGSVAMPTRRRALGGVLAVASVLLASCTNNSNYFSSLPSLSSAPGTAPAPGATLGTGQVKVAVILPLSAAGNAGLAGQAMRNAAEMAFAEFNANGNIQLLMKDDAGTPDGARAAAEQALNEGAEIIVGPLFAQSVTIVGQIARTRNIPVIAFSTDTNVATSGVYLLSFLPELDVQRIVQYATSVGKRSFAALIPDNPYGTVVEAAFKQDVTRRGAKIIALQRYTHDKTAMAAPVKTVAQAAARADALFIPDGGTLHQMLSRRWPPTTSTPKRSSCWAAGYGKTISASTRRPRSTAPGTSRRIPPAIAISPRVIGPASNWSRNALRRSPMMPSRSLPPWSKRKARNDFRPKF